MNADESNWNKEGKSVSQINRTTGRILSARQQNPTEYDFNGHGEGGGMTTLTEWGATFF